jgi:hypothetical protein
MLFKGTMIVAGIVFGVISAAVLFSYDFENGEFHDSIENRSQKSTDMAKQFIVSSPTFSYDGILESLEIEILSVDEFESRILLEGRFKTLHGGYGDRGKQNLSENITSHVIEIVMVDEKIISAVIDSKWDEINQIACNVVTC